jgi:EpsI family protein
MLKFLNSPRSRWLTVLLLAQAAVLYGFSRKEVVPPSPPLSSMPTALPGGWRLYQEGVIEPEVAQVLKADDLLSRTYQSEAGLPLHLFIAAFRSQRTGQAPHSPKNCLPGAGWVPSKSEIITLDVPGHGPIELNQYVVQKGDSASVVLYWYQSRDRSVASEYKAKFYVVRDALRENRTDTALVRVVVPVDSKNVAPAQKAAQQFIQDSFPAIRSLLPS